MAVNHLLGFVIIALAVPSTVALVGFVGAGAEWLYWAGPIAFLVFVGFIVVVDYAWPVEFRSPMRYEVLVPYLCLFFGSILLMGLPMFHLNRQLWFVTVATTVLLLGAMAVAMRKAVA